MMRCILYPAILIVLALTRSDAFASVRPVQSYRPSTVLHQGSFVSRLPPVAEVIVANNGRGVVTSRQRTTRGDLRMGKVSKFGIFSPAVIAAKIALGESRLNKIRGKSIALHSQVITEYCKWVGASSKLRGLLIRKAKRNGDDLGFLW